MLAISKINLPRAQRPSYVLSLLALELFLHIRRGNAGETALHTSDSKSKLFTSGVAISQIDTFVTIALIRSLRE